MLPLAMTSLVVMIGIIRMRRANQPPPLAREFYRPYWEWERANPLGRRLLIIRNWIVVSLCASVTLIFILAFLGIG
jgi:hypothetical protein